jgi:hypothetical protein
VESAGSGDRFPSRGSNGDSIRPRCQSANVVRKSRIDRTFVSPARLLQFRGYSSGVDRAAPLTGRGETPCLEPMRTPRGRTTCGDDQASRDRLRPDWSGRSGPTGGEPTSHAGFEPRVFVESGLAPDPSSLLDGGPAGGTVRSTIETRLSKPDSRNPTTGRFDPLSHPRYRSQTLSKLSGTTLTPATAVMKFRSPDQRGTMWAWRCWGRPAPAASP